MPRIDRRIRVAALSALALAAIAPAGAGATLAFTRNPLHPAVFAAGDNGKGIHRIGAGSSPQVTPDGSSIAYLRAGREPELVLSPAAGGQPRTLMKNWRESFYLAFSPDSKMVAAERGAELGKRKLVMIDLATGRRRVLAHGFFDGFSFSPDSRQLVYSKAGRAFSTTGNLYVTPVGGGKTKAITADHRSIAPLWGPNGRIVFDRVSNLKSEFGPKAQLYLTGSGGGQAKQLTHMPVARLLFGLSPVDWSANGNRLLAEFGGEDTSYAVTVNPRSGAERKVIPGDFEQGFIGAALSADGKLVLGTTGGEEPGPHHHVAVVPYSGGKQKVIVADGYEPDWSR
jgi:Tol biopolymer transport system component